jgi:hypothetical protein
MRFAEKRGFKRSKVDGRHSEKVPNWRVLIAVYGPSLFTPSVLQFVCISFTPAALVNGGAKPPFRLTGYPQWICEGL